VLDGGGRSARNLQGSEDYGGLTADVVPKRHICRGRS
jgi:hypothetical protein